MKVKSEKCAECRKDTVFIKPRRRWLCTGRPASEKALFESKEYQQAVTEK